MILLEFLYDYFSTSITFAVELVELDQVEVDQVGLSWSFALCQGMATPSGF